MVLATDITARLVDVCEDVQEIDNLQLDNLYPYQCFSVFHMFRLPEIHVLEWAICEDA